MARPVELRDAFVDGFAAVLLDRRIVFDMEDAVSFSDGREVTVLRPKQYIAEQQQEAHAEDEEICDEKGHCMSPAQLSEFVFNDHLRPPGSGARRPFPRNN